MEGSVTQCLCLLVSVLKHQKYTAAPRNILGGLFLPAAEPRRNQLKFRTEINWQELELFTGASHSITPRPGPGNYRNTSGFLKFSDSTAAN